MTVPSYAFLGFAALAALLVNVSQRPAWRRGVLLVANLGFLATFTIEPLRLVPFATMLAAGYVALRVLEKRKARAGLVASVALVLVLFCWFKQYGFVPQAFDLTFAYFTVGMSYVFFRIVHLIVDAYQDALPDRVDPLSYLNYTLSFTSLVAGPIQFYRDYRACEAQPASLTPGDAGRAAGRIATGFFKVAILSPIAFWAQSRCIAFVAPGHGVIALAGGAALGTALYPVYLYFNFSGYTDFVIGVARFLRLTLPENFNRPFDALGFIDFWGRWHITLATWVKTYIYTPIVLGFMRSSPGRGAEAAISAVAYFVAFFFVGVWHGQTSMFVCLGVLLGAGMSANKIYQIRMIARLGRPKYRALCADPAYAALSRGLTIAWFSFSSLWFWSSWAQLGQLSRVLGAPGLVLGAAMLLGGTTAALWLLTALERPVDRLRASGSAFFGSAYAATAWYALLVAITLSGTAVLDAPAPHVVYKGF